MDIGDAELGRQRKTGLEQVPAHLLGTSCTMVHAWAN